MVAGTWLVVGELAAGEDGEPGEVVGLVDGSL